MWQNNLKCFQEADIFQTDSIRGEEKMLLENTLILLHGYTSEEDAYSAWAGPPKVPSESVEGNKWRAQSSF